MKVIKINTDHYIIVDDSEIKEGDWCYDIALGIFQASHNYNAYNTNLCKKITHSTQPLYKNDFWAIQELKLSEVKELIGEVDVEKKAEEVYPQTYYSGIHIDGFLKAGYVKGYNQALEDNKDKKYTEEDMKVAITQAFLSGLERLEDFERVQEMILDNIKPKTEWEVEFKNGKLKLV